MGRDAQRLALLRAQGVSFSRNRNFDLFEIAENKSALRLWRRLEALAHFIHLQQRRGTLTLALEKEARGSGRRLVVSVPAMRARIVTRLDEDELVLLLRHHDLAPVFEEAGISLPAHLRARLRPIS